MKLGTDIAPRKDGKVVAEAGSTRYIFEQDGDGNMVADVTDSNDISTLLDTGNFYPVEETDIKAGLELVGNDQASGSTSDSQENDGAESSEPGSQEAATAQAPVTEQTAPAVTAKRGGGKGSRKSNKK